MKRIDQIIEAVLFTWAEAIDVKDLAYICSCDEIEIEENIDILTERLNQSSSALSVKKYGSSYQLVVDSSYGDYLSKLVETKKVKRLSSSSMEVLSIIAYKQPITRIEIEEIRGVRSNSSIDTLLKRGLIEEAGQLDKPGKPFLYKTTVEFLKRFDLNSLEDLPSLDQNSQDEDGGKDEVE